MFWKKLEYTHPRCGDPKEGVSAKSRKQKKAEIVTPAAEELKEAKQPSPDTPEPPQEAIENEKSRVAPEDAHSTRPRCKYFGASWDKWMLPL